MSDAEKALIVVAPYYAEITDDLERGARLALETAGLEAETITVPGAFEIPAAIAHAARAGGYEVFVALGCVIRGETSHYDYVCGECARAVQDLAVGAGLAIGFGVLTVENMDQARVRAGVDGKDKGGEAARAALALRDIKHRFAGDNA